MHVAWTVAIGLVVGLLAKIVMPGRGSGGFFITVAIGIIGAMIATYGGEAIGIYHGGESSGFIGAVIGSVILVLLYRRFVRND